MLSSVKEEPIHFFDVVLTFSKKPSNGKVPAWGIVWDIFLLPAVYRIVQYQRYHILCVTQQEKSLLSLVGSSKWRSTMG